MCLNSLSVVSAKANFWRKVKMKNSFVHPTFVVVRENNLSVSNKTHCSCSCFFHFSSTKKNLPPRPFAAIFWLLFCAQNISLVRWLTRLPHFGGITVLYCRRINTNKKKKESKKGPREREREFTRRKGRIIYCPSSSSSSRAKKKSIYLHLR